VTNLDEIRVALFGIAVGDALGVPVEFKSRTSLKRNPVKDMQSGGYHGQPAGTWSDDSSLTFCLAEAIADGFSLDKVAKNFIRWEKEGYWTAHGNVFDIGHSTQKAINRLKRVVKPELAGVTDESIGNGSLMRILPLLFFIKDKPLDERYELTRLVSSITHAQPECVMGCFYYLEFARLISANVDKFAVYNTLKKEFRQNLTNLCVDTDYLDPFQRLLDEDIFKVGEREIESGGQVDETLEASIWCLLTTNSYSEAVLKAVNLGEDTDTTAAVTGGLAGLLYGFERIPNGWINTISRRDDIDELCTKMYQCLIKM
jgi:ADP-ribosylglycohydrolase